MQKNGLSQQLKRRQKGGTEARRRLGVRLGFVATSPSEGEEEENGTASMMCGRGESHKGVVNRGSEAGQAQTGWDAATTRPVPRSLGPRHKNKVARVDPRTPTSLETARPPLAMSHAYCVVPRRGEATGNQQPETPKGGGVGAALTPCRRPRRDFAATVRGLRPKQQARSIGGGQRARGRC